MSKLAFLFTAYMLIWIALAVYLLSIFSRQRKIDREIALLREEVQGRS